jgi:ABC-type lipoprotein export system ATPase subunit
MVTHDNDAAKAADRLVHIEDGLIVADEVVR